MIRTPMEKLMPKVDSRYTLVVMTAKRARAILDAQQKRGEYGPEKPVTRALREIAEGKVKYSRPCPAEHGTASDEHRVGA